MKFSTSLLFIAFTLQLQFAQAKPAEEKPNFLFILVDDMGWTDLGIYGNTFNETPNIDRMAEEGIKFNNAYSASPVCSPTRGSLQTGLYPARFDMNMIVNPHRRPWAKLLPPENKWYVPAETPTLAEKLSEYGYTSGIIGKWNLGYRSPNLPGDRGYADIPDKVKPGLKDPVWQELKAFAEQNPYKGTGPEILQSALFMEEHKNEPFMCMVSLHSVHIKMEARDELIEKYQQKKSKVATDIHPKYAAMVEMVDESVGLLLKTLKTLDIEDNTVVFLFSDNGGLIQVYHQTGPIVSTNKPLRSEKGTLYEGGIRVPLIIKWPGKIKPNTMSDALVTSNDFYATMVDLAGGKVEGNVAKDAVSLVPELTGNGSLDRSTLYWHYPAYHHSTPASAIRNGKYKLIEFYESGKVELYNLEADIGELNNIAMDRPDIAKQLQNKLGAWLLDVDAGMPALNPNYDPSKAYIWGQRPEKPWMSATAAPLDPLEKCKLIDCAQNK